MVSMEVDQGSANEFYAPNHTTFRENNGDLNGDPVILYFLLLKLPVQSLPHTELPSSAA